MAMSTESGFYAIPLHIAYEVESGIKGRIASLATSGGEWFSCDRVLLDALIGAEIELAGMRKTPISEVASVVGHEVRWVASGSSIYYVASDVAGMLGYKGGLSSTLAKHCDKDGVKIGRIRTAGGSQRACLIDAHNFWRLICLAELPVAEAMKWYVFELLCNNDILGRFCDKFGISLSEAEE